MKISRVVIKVGREKSLRHRHPWVFSGAIDRVEGEPGMGETVSVVAHDGAFLAHAAYCPNSQIRARVWSFDPADAIDEAFFARRLQAAIHRRATLAPGSNGMRLVHGEGGPAVMIVELVETSDQARQFEGAGHVANKRGAERGCRKAAFDLLPI